MRDLIARQPKWLLFGLPSWMVVVGVGLSIYGGHLLRRSSQSASWPSTDGLIRTAKVGHCSLTTYAAEVTYDYSVNGKLLTGDKIRMVNVYHSDMTYAQDDLNKYPVGKKVNVFFSPADCADSVLEPGIHPSSWFVLSCGGLFVTLPLLVMTIAYICGKKANVTT